MSKLPRKGLHLFEYRFRILLLSGKKAFSRFTIHKSHGAYYLYNYVPIKQKGHEKQKEKKFETDFWKFVDGDQKQYKRFLKLYYLYLLQFFWMKKIKAAYLSAVPRSSMEKKNVFADVCEDLSKRNLFAYTCVKHNADLIVRTKDMMPIRLGAKYSVDDIKDSLRAGSDVSGQTVILLDDLVNSGKTARACKDILIEAGAREVYVLCMFACKKEKHEYRQ